MTHPLNHPKNFCTLLSSSLRSLRSLRLIPNHSKNLCTLLSAATAFWKRHFFMPPQQTPALTTMQYPPSNFRGRSRRRQSAHFLAAGRPAPTHAGGYFLALLFALSALLAPASAFAQDATNSTATVTTDQSDYPPGSTVYITGAGFTPGEIVTNQVLHIPDTGDNNTSPAHDPWTVTADDAGNFVTTWDVPFDQDELGATLQLTATGQTSGLPAQTTFTDAGNAPSAPTAVAVSLNPANSPPTVTASISEGGGNPKPNITGAELFIDATGANGAGTAMNPADGLFDTSNENVTKALTSAQFTALAEGGHTVSVHGQDANSTWGAFTSTPFTKDTIAPTVVSINTAGANPTNGATVRFTGTFGGSVSGVDSSDFTLTTSGGVTGTSVGTVTGTGASYTVAVNTGSGDGTIRLDLNSSGTGIADTAGNAITTGFTGGQTNTIDKTPPVLNGASGPASGTYAIGQNLDFTVNYNENMAVTGTPTIGLTIGSTARSATYNAAGSTATALLFRYTVAPGDSDTDGISVASTITVSGGNTIKDTAGNTAPINFPALDTTGVLVDGIAPTVTINQAAGQNDPVNTGPINFTAVFSKPVSDFATGDVSVGGTAGGGVAKTATVSGGPTTYNVSVSGMTTSGTVIATIAPGVAHDSVGNPNTASTSTDGTVTWDVTAPAVPGTPNMTTATDSGYSTSDNITSNTMPAFTGSPAEAGSTVTIYSDGSLVGTGSASGYTGTGGITNTTALTDGSHNITAKATDVAGNTSTASTALGVTIDTQIPITASVTNPVDGAVYSIGTPPPLLAFFGGRAADNSGGAGLALNSTTFTLQRLSDGQYWTGNGTVWQIASNGLDTTHTSTTGNAPVTWHPAALPAWTPDAYRVQATATDKAGNTFTGTAVNFIYTGPNNPTQIGTQGSNMDPVNSLAQTASVAAKSTIFVTVVMDPCIDTVTVSDNLGNAYNPDADISNGTSGSTTGSGARTLVFSRGYTTAFSGTVTVSLPTLPTVVSRNMAATFFSFPDLVTPTAKETSGTLVGSGTVATSGNATTLVPDELQIVAVGVDLKNQSFAPGAGFTPLTSSGTGGNSPHPLTMQPEYKAVHVTATYSGTETNSNAKWAAAIVTYRFKVPAVISIVATNGSPTRASTVSFTVNFSESVVGVDAGDFALNTSGVSGAGIASVTGNDGSYTVTVNTGTGPATGTGSIGLNLVDDGTILDVDSTPLGGTGTTGVRDGSSNSPALYTIDKAGPTLSCVPQSASANASCKAAVTDFTANAAASDPSGVASTTQSPAAGTLVDLGPTIVTVTATDTLGNSNQCQTTFTVNDTTPPTVTVLGPNPMTNQCHSVLVDPGATASDACAGSRAVTTNSTVNANAPGVYQISYSASDGNGNSATNTRTVYVVDTTPPVITLNGSATVTLECHVDSYTEQGAGVSDACDTALTTATVGGDTVNVNATGTYHVTYNATDASGNHALEVTRTVSVQDTTPPLVTILGANPLTNECHSALVDPGATATDACAGSRAVTTNSTVNANAPGVYKICYSSSDGNGNSATNTRTVYVVDTTPPVITLNGSATVTLECHVDSYTEQGAGVSDACDTALTTATMGGDTVNVNATGTYHVTYNATDASGNHALEVTRTVSVQDTTPPLVTILGANPLTNECHSALVDPGATATDACAGSRAVTTNSTVNANAPGVYQISYSSSDGNGNSATNTRTVYVVDTTPPVITLNGSATVTLECHVDSYTEQGAGVSDACDTALTTATMGGD